MHMFRNWISGMGRGFSTAARTALVALACIGPAEAANFTLTLKVSPTGAGSVCAVKGGDQAQETDDLTQSTSKIYHYLHRQWHTDLNVPILTNKCILVMYMELSI